MARRRKRDPTPTFFLGALLVVGVVFAGVELVGFLDAERMEEASRAMEAPEPTEEAPAARERVRVEVLNAAGIPGIAAHARDRLRDEGFDVVYYGNAPSFDRDVSVVVDRVGTPRMAEEVARALGIGAVISEPDPGLLVEASVLLGADWSEGRREEAEEEAPLQEEGEARWWAPGRIFRGPGR